MDYTVDKETTAIVIEDVCNYRGSLQILKNGNKYYWGVQDEIYGDEWYPIPKPLYDMILTHVFESKNEEGITIK